MSDQALSSSLRIPDDASLPACMQRLEFLVRVLTALVVEDLRRDAEPRSRLRGSLSALSLPWSPSLLPLLEAFADDLAEHVRPTSGPRAILLRFLLLDDYVSRATKAVLAATAGEGFGAANQSAPFTRAASCLLALAAGPHGRSGDSRVTAAVRTLVTEMTARLDTLGSAVLCLVKGARPMDEQRTRLTLVPIGASHSDARSGVGTWSTPPALDEVMLSGAPLPQPVRLHPWIVWQEEELRFLAATPRRPDPVYLCLDPAVRPSPAVLSEIVPHLMPDPVTIAGWRSILGQEISRIGQRTVAIGTSVVGALTDSDVSEGSIVADRFELGKELSRGTVGAVFVGREIDTGEPAIVKVMVKSPTATADSEELARAAFVREAEVLQLVSHRGVPRLLFDGNRHEPPFVAIETFPSRSLRDLLGEGPLPFPRARQLMMQLAEIVGALHAQGIVHRDIKPENVLVGNDDRLLLIDYGLALTRAADGVMPPDIGGTLPYMAPESMAGGPISPPTDVFALGVVLYECLTAAPLFQGASRREVADAIRRGRRAPAASLDGPGRSLHAVIEACTDPRPGHRPGHGGKVHDLIAAAPDRPPEQVEGGFWARLFGRRP